MLNLSEEGNYIPNLIWIDKILIKKKFLCVAATEYADNLQKKLASEKGNKNEDVNVGKKVKRFLSKSLKKSYKVDFYRTARLDRGSNFNRKVELKN